MGQVRIVKMQRCDVFLMSQLDYMASFITADYGVCKGSFRLIDVDEHQGDIHMGYFRRSLWKVFEIARFFGNE